MTYTKPSSKTQTRKASLRPNKAALDSMIRRVAMPAGRKKCMGEGAFIGRGLVVNAVASGVRSAVF